MARLPDARPTHEGPALVAFLGSADLRLEPVDKVPGRGKPAAFRLVWTGDHFAGDGWTAVPKQAGDGRMDLEARRDGGRSSSLLRASDAADPGLATSAHLDPFASARLRH